MNTTLLAGDILARALPLLQALLHASGPGGPGGAGLSVSTATTTGSAVTAALRCGRARVGRPGRLVCRHLRRPVRYGVPVRVTSASGAAAPAASSRR